MTITLFVIVGAIVGFGAAVVFTNARPGCVSLLIIPIAMYFYVDWWVNNNPDLWTSTIALEYFFGPLWPSLGAAVGFLLGRDFKKRF